MPSSETRAPWAGMEPSDLTSAPSETSSQPATQPVVQIGSADGAADVVVGELRPANEAILEQLVPTSAMLRKRAFSSLLRVLLSGKGE